MSMCFVQDSSMNHNSATLPPLPPPKKKPRTQIRICLSLLLLLLSGASLSRKGRRGRRRVRHIRFPPRTKFEIKKEEGERKRYRRPTSGKGWDVGFSDFLLLFPGVDFLLSDLLRSLSPRKTFFPFRPITEDQPNRFPGKRN